MFLGSDIMCQEVFVKMYRKFVSFKKFLFNLIWNYFYLHFLGKTPIKKCFTNTIYGGNLS